MRKLIVIALAALMLLSLAACGKKNEPEEAEDEPFAGMPNPFVEYATVAEAVKAAGFDMEAPEALEGYGEKMIQVMNGKMIQIIFLDGEDRVFFRKAKGSDDISGDYNEYSQTRSVTVGDYTVTVKGDDDLVKVAMWTYDGCTYAVMTDKPMSVEKISDLIGQVS